MAGGLMQIAATGGQNVYLTGNPTTSYFYGTYRKHTNFATQKFILDFEGAKTLRLTEPSTFTFKVKRHADLLMDCYLSFDLPNIWSPLLPPQRNPETGTYSDWIPYEFRWIDNIGTKMIKKIQITCGNYTLQEYSGDYLLSAVQRDFLEKKRELFDDMTGNIPDLVDPANAQQRNNIYPNAYYSEANGFAGPDPSIRGKTIYIPLNTWFGLNSQMAFPLVALQNAELQIIITLRPINELFQIRDLTNAADGYPYVAPNFNSPNNQFYRFLQPPPIGIYTDTRTQWNTNLHLNCTYAFLGRVEQHLFASQEMTYMMKQVHEYPFYNITGANKVRLDSLGMVTGWLFYMQRSDVNLRNEWSNYSNWPYLDIMPKNVKPASVEGIFPIYDEEGTNIIANIGPGINPDGTSTDIFLTPPFSHENNQTIMQSMGILLNGEYRENVMPVGVFDLIEKYTRTSGNAPRGLFCYQYGINSNNNNLQPSGSINMNLFNKIELELTTAVPPIDPNAQSMTICDPDTGDTIGINKPTWRIYEYNYNLFVFEERVNFVKFSGGSCGLMYAT